MGHEKSETVKRSSGWVNVYGKGASGGKPGRRLPNSGTYLTAKEAVVAAKSRSDRTLESTPHLRKSGLPSRIKRKKPTPPRPRAKPNKTARARKK